MRELTSYASASTIGPEGYLFVEGGQGMRTSITLTVLFLACSIAKAQSVLSWSPQQDPEPAQEEVSEESSTYHTVMLYGRVSSLDGELEKESLFFSGLDYTDLFGTGTGFMIEGSKLWELGGLDSWYLGGYLSFGFDSYGGKKDTDSVGDSLDPDDLDIVTFLGGIKGTYPFGSGFYGEGHLGIGAATYSAVDGTLTIAGTPFDVDVFKSSTVFAFDMGLRIGYSNGPFIAELGFGLRIQGKPKTADLDFNNGEIVEPAFEIGAGFKF